METEDSLAQLPKKNGKMLTGLTTIMCNIHTERDKNMKSVKRFLRYSSDGYYVLVCTDVRLQRTRGTDSASWLAFNG